MAERAARAAAPAHWAVVTGAGDQHEGNLLVDDISPSQRLIPDEGRITASLA